MKHQSGERQRHDPEPEPAVAEGAGDRAARVGDPDTRRRPSPRRTWGFSRRDRFLLLLRYWRGPTWVNRAWLRWLGLVRLGDDREASDLAAGVQSAVGAAGLRE